MIFVLSQWHTGTWTTINYLYRHDGVDGFQQVCAWGRHDHNHRIGPSLSVREHMGRNMVLHDHMDVASRRYAPMLAHLFPVVIPMRDPLASLITKVSREPDDPLDGYWSGWRHLVEVLGLGHVVPVDLDPDWPAVSRHCGLQPSGTMPPPTNVSARRALHAAYATRDVEALREGLGGAWGTLRRMEGHLRPLLEALGYRDLVWWS